MVRGELACLVWHGARLLIRTVGGDMELGARECGGGHRSWDVAEQGGRGELVYIKEREVLMTSLWAKEKKVLLAGGHTQQVNVVKQFKCGKLRYHATGGEETNIRVYKVGGKVCMEVAVRRLSVDAWVVETCGDDTEVVVTRLVTEAVVQWWEGGSCCAAHWGLCVRAVGGHHRVVVWRMGEEESVWVGSKCGNVWSSPLDGWRKK